MKKMIRMLRVTVVGGVLFMFPFVLIVFFIGKSLEIVRVVINPIARVIPIESVAGLETPGVLAFILLVLLCFCTGLLARTTMAKNLVKWLETTLLSNLPGYLFIKNLGEEVAGSTPTEQYQSVLARFDDAWQLGFLVERLEDGRAVIFIPGSPRPWSGSIFIFDEDRLTLIDQATGASVRALQKLGVGMAELVKGKMTPAGGNLTN